MGLLSSLSSSLVELSRASRALPDVPKMLPWGGWGPSRLLARNVAVRPDAVALLFEGTRATWRDVDAASSRWARVLASRGVSKGDVVALVFDNRPDLLFAQLGCAKLGATAALVNSTLAGAPLSHALAVAAPTLVVAGVEHEARVRDALPEARVLPSRLLVKAEPGEPRPGTVDEELAATSSRDGDWVAPRAEDPSSYIYTSGTTGLPKAAIIRNQRVMGASLLYARVIHELSPGDVLMVTLPLYHSNAQWMGWGACLAAGATMALSRRFSARAFFADASRAGATHFLYIGEICRYLLQTPASPHDRAHRLRVGVGNGLRADVWAAFQARFGVPVLREFYGATEGNALLVNLEGRPGMIGRLRPGQRVIAADASTGAPLRGPDGACRDVAVGETGLLVARISRLVGFDGYVDGAASQKKVLRGVSRPGDAYFDSGDLLTLHADRWVSFADRVGDTFRWKGENVSTGEVGAALDLAPGVLESTVYGVAVPGAEGRCGMASLRVDEAFSLDAFARHVERLPGYQRPYFLRLQREITVTATFKQKKATLRDDGYDPCRSDDPLFFLEGGAYRPIDAALHARLASGEVGPR
ncbi:MAG: long-chain-acyl-CoA synthetase [Polyangiaceae bacterium]|nr:long-chain-acyl-CoA synthetase [Polyangiaceae bacterium]